MPPSVSNRHKKTLPLSIIEEFAVNFFKNFSKQEQIKCLDILSRFSMAKKHTGEIRFDFQWLLNSEIEYDPLVNPKKDSLKGITS